MALAKGTNSYVSVTEANGYFDNRLDVAAWTDALDPQKEQALVTATSLLDNMQWIGEVWSSSQSLAWPRNASYFDPFYGSEVMLDTNVPQRIEKACMELAYHLLNNDGLLDNTGNISSISLGSLSINSPKNPDSVPTHVRNMIRPLLSKRNRTGWWRAN